jgi:hypothetical protein
MLYFFTSFHGKPSGEEAAESKNYYMLLNPDEIVGYHVGVQTWE